MLINADSVVSRSMMTSERAKLLLAKAEAIIEGHFVGTSGNHLSMYVAKDRATRLTSIASELCCCIAERFFIDGDIDVVVAPACGGIALAQWTAHHLTRLRPDRPEVMAVYCEHEEELVAKGPAVGGVTPALVSTEFPFFPGEGDKLVLVKRTFALRRGFAEDVRGKRTLAVEDILTTGGSARETVRAILNAGGDLVGLAALVNGGKLTAEKLGVPRLETLAEVEREIYGEHECKLCHRKVPVNTNFGHGQAFLDRQQAVGL